MEPQTKKRKINVFWYIVFQVLKVLLIKKIQDRASLSVPLFLAVLQLFRTNKRKENGWGSSYSLESSLKVTYLFFIEFCSYSVNVCTYKYTLYCFLSAAVALFSSNI